MTQAVLSLSDVGYQVSADFGLHEISFDIAPGEVCVLLGANGAGKSTLMSLCCGIIRPRVGSITLAGRDLFNHGYIARRALGAVFQSSTLDLDLDVMQNLSYQAYLQGLDPDEGALRIAEGLERYDLTALSRRRCGALSGGERRRVELIRALLHRPSLLLMDEATAGIDISQRLIFAQEVRQRCLEDGVAALWTTHLSDEVQINDPVVVLHQGRVVARGVAHELMREYNVTDIQALYPTLIAVHATQRAS